MGVAVVSVWVGSRPCFNTLTGLTEAGGCLSPTAVLVSHRGFSWGLLAKSRPKTSACVVDFPSLGAAFH